MFYLPVVWKFQYSVIRPCTTQKRVEHWGIRKICPWWIKCPLLNIPLMKFEIVCFCPWWKIGADAKISIFLALLTYSAPHLSDRPRGRKICPPDRDISDTLKMESAPDEKNPGHTSCITGVQDPKQIKLTYFYVLFKQGKLSIFTFIQLFFFSVL